MNATIIQYSTKPESTEHNTALIEAVFRELAAGAPDGVRYAVFRSADGSFVHLFAHESEVAAEKLTGLPAFAAFIEGGEERRTGPPVRSELTIVGNYRMLAK
jgi:hypothetical protein